jgi:hypothetical protein
MLRKDFVVFSKSQNHLGYLTIIKEILKVQSMLNRSLWKKVSQIRDIFGIFKSIVFQKWFWFPERPPVPELWRGKVYLFWENAFGKSAITFHPLSRFCRNIACFKDNLFRKQKIFWVLEFFVFSWNDVMTKLKNFNNS